MKMRILFLEANEVGGYIGGRLLEWQQRMDATNSSAPSSENSDPNFCVTFFVSRWRAEQLQQDGLLLKNPDGSVTTISNIATLAYEGQGPQVNPNTTARFDVIILTQKLYGYDLHDSLDSIEPLVHPEVAILPLSIEMEYFPSIQERFPEATLWGGTCDLVASFDRTTGIIHQKTPARFVRAGTLLLSRSKEKDGSSSTDKLTTLMRLLQQAGFDAEVSDDILGIMWNRFLSGF